MAGKLIEAGARVMIVVNPVSGRGRGRFCADGVTEFLGRRRATSRIFETTPTESGAGYAEKAAAGKFTRIVCIGGDGTLNAVLNGLVRGGTALPVTYMPMGTTNDFARTLGIPHRAPVLRRMLVSGEDITVDAGQFNGRAFTYVASFGAFTRASYATPRSSKQMLGHFAYVLEGMRDLADLPSMPLRVVTPEGEITGDYSFGAFSNTRSIGGIVKLDEKQVDMRDGRLEMLLIRRPETLPEVHRLVRGLSTGDFSDALFTFCSAEKFTVEMAQGLQWAVDGECVPAGKTCEISCLRNALTVTVPAADGRGL